MIDQFYTPPGLAALLVDTAKARSAKLVADFAMGDGALLRAAAARWPSARLFGSDIDPSVGETADVTSAGFSFRAFDFLADDRDELHELKGRCDIILLNPPFTCRGSKRFPVTVDGAQHTGSKALVFAVRALRYLQPGGELLAILPASCVSSQRDARLLHTLKTKYAVDQIGEIQRNVFSACSVGIILVRFKVRGLLAKSVRCDLLPGPVAVKDYAATVMRGCTPIHKTSPTPAGLPVLHTDGLRSGSCSSRRWTAAPKRIVEGSVILMPRVGRPDPSKLVMAYPIRSCLSDCVIAIRTDPPGREQELLRLMRANWAQLERSYGGSCAPYLTMASLSDFLRRLGVVGRVVQEHEPAVGEPAKAAIA